LGDQILKNFDVTIGSCGMPDIGAQVRNDERRPSAKTLSYIGVYVFGSGAFGDKPEER
jgi:hypothetical protein